MSVHEEGSEPIEGYWLIKLLGGGEYGSVWKATDHDGKPCVIKFISLGRQLTGAEIGALRKMKDVRHPYLAHVSSAWLLSSTNRNFTIVDRHPEQLSEIDELAIVTTYLDQSLAMILIRHKHQSTSGIPPFELLPYVAQAAQVIDFFNEPVHDLGSSEPVAIYHCDIRPANLLIGPDGDLRVSDFGMGRTRARGGESSQPLVPTVIAPPARYSPPELILDESDNAQTDQYSLAISYYELRTGLLSFTSDDLRDTVQLRQAHIEGRLTFNEVPDAERIVLQKATSKKQADRFSSAGEMVRALRAAVTARQKLSRNLAAPANTDTDAHSIASPILRIMVFERGRTVFTDTFSGAIELGRQNNEQETPYSKTEVSPGYSRAVIAGYDEPYISRKHMKLESVGERSVRITNLSTKVLAWSHGDTASSTHGGINLPPALTTQDLPLPVTLVIGSVAVRVELAGQGQTPVGGSTSTPDVSVEDLLRTFGEMTTASLSADGLPDLCRKVARAVVETVGMDAAWVLLHESGGWSAVSEYFSPDVVRDPGWQPDQNVLRVLLKAKISFWVGPEQNAPDLKVRPKGVDVVFVAPILDSGSAVVGAVYGDCRQGARPVARTRVSKQQAMLVKSFANAIETMWERVHPVSVSPSSDVPAPPSAENPQTYRCTKCGREWAPDLAHDNEFVCTRKCGGFLELVGPTAAPIANAPTTSDPVATVRPLSATAPVGVLRGHGAEVICLAFHPDGHLLASGSSDRTARMWDVVAGTQLLAPFEHGATVSGLAFSPGGTRVVTACWDWGVRTWGVADGTELFASWRHAAKVTGVAVIDSQRIASGSADGHLSVWGVRGAVPSVGSANFGRLADLLWSRDFRQPVMAVTAAGDRRTLIVVGEQGSIGLYEADTGKELARSEGVMLGLSCCAVAPDGRRLVAGGGDGTVCVWELPSFQSLAGRTSHHGAVRGLAFFPDGRLIASGGSDGTVRIWDAESGSELSCWHGPQGGVNCVAISPDGRSIASGGADATICLWEAAVLTTAGAFLTPTRKPREEKATERDIDSADASALAVAAVHRFLHDRTSGVLVLENEHDQEELIALLVDHEFKDSIPPPVVVSFGKAKVPARQSLLQLHHSLLRLKAHGKLDAQDGRTQSERGEMSRPAKEGDLLGVVHDLVVNILPSFVSLERPQLIFLDALDRAEPSVTWRNPIDALPDHLAAGIFIVAASKPVADRSAFAWRQNLNWFPEGLSSVDLVCRGHEGWVPTVAFLPDEPVVISGGKDGTIRLWDTQSGKEVLSYRCHDDLIDGVAVSPDGNTVVSASWDKSVVITDRRARRFRKLVGHSDRVNAIAFCPDRQRIASGGDDGSIRIWNVADGTESARLNSGSSGVLAVTWTPDGRRLVSGTFDHLIHVWDVPIGREGRELYQLIGHQGSVCCLAFTPDGQLLASGAFGEQILIWKPDNPQPVLRLVGHEHAVYGLAFSPDGRLLSSASADNTIRLWEFPGGTEVACLRGHTSHVHDVTFSPDGSHLASGSGDGTVRIWDLVSRGFGTSVVSRPTISVYPWHLSLDASPSGVAAVGQPLTLTLRLAPEAGPGTVPLQLPANVLELTAYVEASAFHLEGEHTRTLAVVEGIPVDRTLAFRLSPVSSGEQVVRVLVYPGGRVTGVGPAELKLAVTVAAPVALPDFPELLDSRAVPDPQPDVLLIVTLEETADGERVAIYLSCSPRGRERQRLDPPLDLTARDATALRRAASEMAGGVAAAPCDALAALRAFGRDLFQRLMPHGHPLREAFWRIRHEAASENGPRSWLILSDAAVLLPWEFICPWGVRRETNDLWHDDFLAGTFQVAHWVGRCGFSLAVEAPFGRLDLAHYGQKPDELPLWQQALGGDEVVGIEGRAGHLALTAPGSPYHGLHLLRYSDPCAGPVTRWEEPGGESGGRGTAETLLYERRLDFTRRRPVVGLSFIQDGSSMPSAAAGETDLEAGWVLPILHAGASAVVGPRSHGPGPGALLFAETFYEALRTGAPLCEAVALARGELRRTFPERPDWIAYAHFGHPGCRPYAVRPAEGFTLFEALDQPEGEPFRPGASYRFRASYRSEAPVWFAGRLRSAADADGGEVSVMVVPLDGRGPTTYRLDPAPGGADRQCVLTLTMPADETTLPVLVRFERDGRELRTLTVTLDVAEEVRP